MPRTLSLQQLVSPDTFALEGPNRGLMFSVWWNVGLMVLSLAAMPFDRRVILGLNPWVKPLKFDISVIIFLMTVAVLLSALCERVPWPRARVWISWGIGIAMIFEDTIIAMQSLRGVPSHMNYSTWFNAMSFATMGLFIGVNTVLVAVLLVLYLVSRTGLPQPLTLGIQLGLAFLLAGSSEGVFMIVRYSAHTVGAADGGPGLFFVNWSTSHGDLRVPHFFALHALQILTLAGWAISRTKLTLWAQNASVAGISAVYFAGVWFLFAQAVAGRPFLR